MDVCSAQCQGMFHQALSFKKMLYIKSDLIYKTQANDGSLRDSHALCLYYHKKMTAWHTRQWCDEKCTGRLVTSANVSSLVIQTIPRQKMIFSRSYILSGF